MLDKNQRIDMISYYVLNDESGNFYIANKNFTKAKTLDQFVQELDGQKLYDRNDGYGWCGYHLGSRNGIKLKQAFPVGCKTIADLYERQDRYKKLYKHQNERNDLLNF